MRDFILRLARAWQLRVLAAGFVTWIAGNPWSALANSCDDTNVVTTVESIKFNSKGLVDRFPLLHALEYVKKAAFSMSFAERITLVYIALGDRRSMINLGEETSFFLNLWDLVVARQDTKPLKSIVAAILSKSYLNPTAMADAQSLAISSSDLEALDKVISIVDQGQYNGMGPTYGEISRLLAKYGGFSPSEKLGFATAAYPAPSNIMYKLDLEGSGNTFAYSLTEATSRYNISSALKVLKARASIKAIPIERLYPDQQAKTKILELAKKVKDVGGHANGPLQSEIEAAIVPYLGLTLAIRNQVLFEFSGKQNQSSSKYERNEMYGPQPVAQELVSQLNARYQLESLLTFFANMTPAP